MPPRDPRKAQLDFPQLVADIIEQLQLTGTVGLLDFSPSVQPVYIAAQREGALSIDTSAPAYDSAEIFSNVTGAPAINAVLADTGQLVAGDYDVIAYIKAISGASGANTPIFELQHRNAANSANLWDMPHSFYTNAAVGVGVEQTFPFALTVAGNERIRWQNTSAAASGVQVDTAIFAKRRVVP